VFLIVAMLDDVLYASGLDWPVVDA